MVVVRGARALVANTSPGQLSGSGECLNSKVSAALHPFLLGA